MPQLDADAPRFLVCYPPRVALARTRCPDCGQVVFVDWITGQGACYGPGCGAIWHVTVDPTTLPAWPFASAMAEVACWACGGRAVADCLRGEVACESADCGNRGTLRQWVDRAESVIPMTLLHP
jgi:hypothetical protein